MLYGVPTMNIWNRIFCGALLFFSAILLPWWLGAILIIYFFFEFNNYYELFFFGLLLDILYGSDRPIIFIITILLYIILRYLKGYLRPYV